MQIAKIVVGGLFIVFSVATVIFTIKATYAYFLLARSIKHRKNLVTNLVPISMLLPGTYDKDGKREHRSFMVSLGFALVSFFGAIFIKVFYL